MIAAISANSDALYGVGLSKSMALKNAKENTFHSLHPVVNQQDSVLYAEVMNGFDGVLVMLGDVDCFSYEMVDGKARLIIQES